VTDFVTDASIVCAWFLPDENNRLAQTAFARLETQNAIAPALLLYEVRNTLLIAERRHRIAATYLEKSLSRLRRLKLTIVEPEDDLVLLNLARNYQLSGYDATYLALAVQKRLPLATIDKKLAAAAAREQLTFN